MLKKIFSALLAAALIASCFTGCGGDTADTTSKVQSNASSLSGQSTESSGSDESSYTELAETFEMRDELTVTTVASADLPNSNADNVVACYTSYDGNGTTSIRFETTDAVKENKYPENSVTVFGDRSKYPATYTQHDRDLGQTFRTGSTAQSLDAVYLRLGPNGADSSVCGAGIAIQIFEISGEPALNDNGTPGYSGFFDRVSAPEMDDYLEGETYKSVAVAKGTLPTTLSANSLLKFDLTGESEIVMAPNRDYAFMVMLIDPKPEQQLSLANNYYGSYAPVSENKYIGHGIRREGNPKFSSTEERVKQSPCTLGFPDVCTWRDYYFFVTAK